MSKTTIMAAKKAPRMSRQEARKALKFLPPEEIINYLRRDYLVLIQTAQGGHANYLIADQNDVVKSGLLPEAQEIFRRLAEDLEQKLGR